MSPEAAPIELNVEQKVKTGGSDVKRAPTSERSLAAAVGAAATRLQQGFFGAHGDREQAQARATLAELRRAVGTVPEKNPVAWQRVLEEVIPSFPENQLGHSDAASSAERAAYDAMTFLALHLQSQSTPMHERGTSFGTAVGTLIRRRDSKSIKPRFDAALSVRSETTRRYHIRNLISLLRSERIGFDYGRFAADLNALSSPSAHLRHAVLLRWGRDVAARRAQPDETNEIANDGATRSTETPSTSESSNN